MKKTLCILLTLLLILPTLTVGSFAEEELPALQECTAIQEVQEVQEVQDLQETPAVLLPQEDVGETDESAQYNPDYVADFYLMSNASGFPSLGHIWVYVENKSPVPIQVGCYTCPPGEGVSIGAFGLTRSDGFGVYYNIEAYCANKYPEKMKSCYHRKTEMNEAQLQRVSNRILNGNWWDPMFVNCIFFALSLWNAAGGTFMFPWRVFPVFAKISLMIFGEKGADMFDPGRDRVYKQRGFGKNATVTLCKDGSVDTVPG